MAKNNYDIFRNVCPRNCYSTCAMLSYVRDGKLVKVAGDPCHGYTQGKLCAKGYAFTEYVYSPDRIRYPLRQYPRGTGKWQRITWDEALEQIAEKILDLNRRYGSNLPLAFNKYSGNIGLLHYAVEGMFTSFGAHTKPQGDSCLAAGYDAIAYDFGQAVGPDPEEMALSKLIVLWGTNPAWTAIHQYGYLNQARAQGAIIVVIDPLFTPTAAKADLYLQIRPGTDGLLALAICKILLENGNIDHHFVDNYIWGFEPFENYLNNRLPSLAEISRTTGIPPEGIRELASLFAESRPCSTWVGFGLQRNANGGQNIRSINALMAITGNIGHPGSGLYYQHLGQASFPLNLLNHQGPPGAGPNRLVNLNNFAAEILALDQPPVKLLWIAGRNCLSQDQNLAGWKILLRKLDLVVTVDLFMTETAKMSDIVLPAASHFEEADINLSYWHHWLALNQKAIYPFFEAKSDLAIARELTRKLNALSPGFSNFPSDLTAEDWLAREFTPEVLSLYGLKSWEELKEGPRKLQYPDNSWITGKFPTPSGKIEIYSPKAKKNNLPAISRFKQPQAGKYPLRVLSPQNLLSIHSQYEWLAWFAHESADVVKMNPRDAEKRRIHNRDTVKLFNAAGTLIRKARITESVPPGVVVVSQGGSNPINALISEAYTDMGSEKTGSNNVAFYETYVECVKSI